MSDAQYKFSLNGQIPGIQKRQIKSIAFNQFYKLRTLLLTSLFFKLQAPNKHAHNFHENKSTRIFREEKKKTKAETIPSAIGEFECPAAARVLVEDFLDINSPLR